LLLKKETRFPLLHRIEHTAFCKSNHWRAAGLGFERCNPSIFFGGEDERTGVSVELRECVVCNVAEELYCGACHRPEAPKIRTLPYNLQWHVQGISDLNEEIETLVRDEAADSEEIASSW